MGFLQIAPELPNAWTSDRILREGMRFHLGEAGYAEAAPMLGELGRTVTDPATLALAAQAEREPPELVRSGAVAAILHDARESVRDLHEHDVVGDAARAVDTAADRLLSRLRDAGDDDARAQAEARPLALGLAATYACARLCRQGAWAIERGFGATAQVACRLAGRGLVPPPAPEDLGLGMGEARIPSPGPR